MSEASFDLLGRDLARAESRRPTICIASLTLISFGGSSDVGAAIRRRAQPGAPLARPSTLLVVAALICTPTLILPTRAAPLSQKQFAALGDLTPFQNITNDALALATKGDIAAAQKRGTDLETAWDEAEDKLKPTDPSRWRVVDKAIDRVLAELRAASPKQASVVAALRDLAGVMAKGGAA